jgi:alkylated DNA nucleotide flippase Atl1
MVAYVFGPVQPGVIPGSSFPVFIVPFCAAPSIHPKVETMPESIHRPNEAPQYARLVLDLVRRIPPAKVMTYGDIAEFLERGTARQVGAVLAGYGSQVSWWRVVNASGRLPDQLRGEAAANYLSEGTPYDLEREKVRLDACRWDGLA